MLLSDDEKRQIEAEFEVYAYKQGAVTDALKIVQKRRGWVSDEDVRDVAEFLDMSPDHVDSVATFYSLIFREPVGRHVILVCDSISCWVMGYNEVREHLTKRLGITLGQTTPDGRFTMVPSACLGVCEQAPAMMIDEDVHGHLTNDKIDAILERYK